MTSGLPRSTDIVRPARLVRFVPIGDIPMLFNRLSSLRDDQDRREVIYAKNLPRNSPATCLRGIAAMYGSG